MTQNLYCESSASPEILGALWFIAWPLALTLLISLVVVRIVLLRTSSLPIVLVVYALVSAAVAFLVPSFLVGDPSGWGVGLMIQILIPVAFFAGLPVVLRTHRKVQIASGVIIASAVSWKITRAIMALLAVCAIVVWFIPVFEESKQGTKRQTVFPGVSTEVTCADFGMSEVVEQSQTVSDAANVDVVATKPSTFGAYTFQIETAWTRQLETSVTDNGITYSDVYVVVGVERLMKISWPVREIGYEGLTVIEQKSVPSTIGNLQKTVYVDPVQTTQGFARYIWDGGSDFWGGSFEIFVYFRDTSLGNGTTFVLKNLEHFRAAEKSIETMISTINW